MSGLDNLKKRLNYVGGGNQQVRMNTDKLRSLRKALLYSYQAATIELANGNQFRALMNPNKVTMDVDDKIISIPFEDICLNAENQGKTSEGMIPIDLKVGDTFEWVDNHTHWIVLLNRYEETAYFRGNARRCRTEVNINGKNYWIYMRGPVEQSILWMQVSGDYFNKLNYTVILYITKDENTEDFFHRFKTIKIQGKPWEVQAVDTISSDGIIEVALKETFSNPIEEEIQPEAEIEVVDEDTSKKPKIIGPAEVKPYDIVTYSLENIQDFSGVWSINNNKAKINAKSENSIQIEITTGKSGNFRISYQCGNEFVEREIKISSL